MLSQRQKTLARRIARTALAERTDRLAERSGLKDRLDRIAETGRVAMIHGGMDCDGVRVEGCVDILPAAPMAVERWWDRACATAEGPVWGRLAAPSAARGVSPARRDLALEAFENGHPHVLHV